MIRSNVECTENEIDDGCDDTLESGASQGVRRRRRW